jgi:hypothetical protein
MSGIFISIIAGITIGYILGGVIENIIILQHKHKQLYPNK